MRIAIVGSGIAGLTAAWRLRGEHEVVVMEADNRPGGHTHTVDIDLPDQRYAVDTGFIVYNDRTYPRFIELLAELGIRGENSEMSFAMSCARTGHEYCSRLPFGIFARPASLFSPQHLHMLLEILRFNREAPAMIGSSSAMSLQDYLGANGYSPTFQRFYIYPLCASIWSGSLNDAKAFPAVHFIEFFDGHGLLSVNHQPQWMVVPGGSREYLRRITAQLGQQLRLNCPVRTVSRHADHVEITTESGTERYDEVVLACHSDQSLNLLADPSPAERDILGALPFKSNDAVLHTDSRLMPRRRAAWASWNYLVSGNDDDSAPITYHMNRLQNLQAPVDFCLTLNRTGSIDPAQVLRRFEYAHPVYTASSNAARARVGEISGLNRTHYCGAWRYHGFHEDGVRSGMDVASTFARTALAA